MYVGAAQFHFLSYRQVCSGDSGHAEATLVVYDPSLISLADLLRNFYRCHNPTQGNRQGRDEGSQYRSGIYLSSPDDEAVARAATAAFQLALDRNKSNLGGHSRKITTEIRGDAPHIWSVSLLSLPPPPFPRLVCSVCDAHAPASSI